MLKNLNKDIYLILHFFTFRKSNSRDAIYNCFLQHFAFVVMSRFWLFISSVLHDSFNRQPPGWCLTFCLVSNTVRYQSCDHHRSTEDNIAIIRFRIRIEHVHVRHGRCFGAVIRTVKWKWQKVFKSFYETPYLHISGHKKSVTNIQRRYNS